MGSDSNERFNIYFAGQCLDGFPAADVRAAIAKLFKADDATLERLFSGARQLIKRDCDRDTALTYQRAMKAAGAKPLIVPAETEDGASADKDAAPASPAAAASPVTPAATSAEGGSLSLAPSGTDVLRPEERPAPVTREVDTSHLQTAPVGASLGETPDTAPAVVAPDFEVAAPGSLMQETEEATNSVAPDTSQLSVSGEALDLSDCAPPPDEPPPLDLDYLKLAESGADVLTEEERRRDEPAVPDTSHLSLSESQGAADDPPRRH